MPYDPNSVVDFLRSRSEDSSLEARRRLWARVKASEHYTGSAAQNTLLLRALRLGASAPRLTLAKSTFALPGSGAPENILCTVESSGPVRIETAVGDINALPGEIISLGTLDRAGYFPLRATTGTVGTEMAFVAVPAEGHIETAIFSTSYEYQISTPSSPPLLSEDIATFQKFVDHATTERMKEAFQPAFDAFSSADRWYGLGFEVAIGGVITIFQPVGGAMFVAKAAVPQVIDFTELYLPILVDKVHAGGDLTDDERDRLKHLIAFTSGAAHGAAIVATGFNVHKLAKTEKVCDLLESLGSGGDHTVKLIELNKLGPQRGDLQMVGSMLRDSVTGSIAMYCELKKIGSP